MRLSSKSRPARSAPQAISKDSVREMLQNPFYTGTVPYYGKEGRRRKKPVFLSPGKHQALVSQEILHTLSIARYGYLIENGAIDLSGPADQLRADPRVKESYLGL